MKEIKVHESNNPKRKTLKAKRADRSNPQEDDLSASNIRSRRKRGKTPKVRESGESVISFKKSRRRKTIKGKKKKGKSRSKSSKSKSYAKSRNTDPDSEDAGDGPTIDDVFSIDFVEKKQKSFMARLSFIRLFNQTHSFLNVCAVTSVCSPRHGRYTLLFMNFYMHMLFGACFIMMNFAPFLKPAEPQAMIYIEP